MRPLALILSLSMLAREEVNAFYRAALPRGAETLQVRLSPLLCHRIVVDDHTTPLAEVDELPGSPSASVCLPRAVWRGLPLHGLQPSIEPERLHASLLHAVSTLGKLWPSRQLYICDWISWVQWVEQDPANPGPLLTSSTFPALPHCAFMSTKAQRHIPPNLVFASDSQYALFENLFHEALHQQLSSTILFLDSIRPDFTSNESRKIPVPWRGQAWEPDRVLHATLVYGELLNLRLDACTKGIEIAQGFTAEAAIQDARSSLVYLCAQFDQVREVFTESGQRLVDEVLSKAQLALGRCSSIELRGAA